MKKIDIGKIIRILEKEVEDYDVPVIDLIKIHTNDPFKILVSTMLSARTKDEITSAASRRLYEAVNGFKDISRMRQRRLEELIYPVGFYKTKAKNLKMLAEIILTDYKNKIPQSIDELVKLPGVGRKTANLVVNLAFGKESICVDTHVFTVLNRLGYVKTKTPHQTELVLRKKLPKRYWRKINTILVAFGQNTCVPVSPFCSRCAIRKYCNRLGVKKSR